ncbi:AP2-containing protein [Hordeum vulgare]|nr:AP2-containing protein [Hordeum vulgare]
MEFTDIDCCFWLDTYSIAAKAARAYDVAMWRARRPRSDLSFPEIETRADAEFLVLEDIHMEEMAKKTKKKPTIVVAPTDSDDGEVRAGASRVCLGQA